MGSLGSDEAAAMPPPAYPGEDTRPTSRKELLGFYTYGFAAEVFVVCGLGAFIPITLEDLARASATAVLAHDHSKPCKVTTIDIPDAAPDIRSVAKHGGAQCVVTVLGTEINTASFAMYTFSLSVLLQALLVVTMSGAADHGRYRKTLLVTFAVVGSVATMLFLPVTPAIFLLGAIWAIVANVCFGASFVLLNSFLPLLVRHHPAAMEQRDAVAEEVPAYHDEVSESARCPPPCPLQGQPVCQSGVARSKTYDRTTVSHIFVELSCVAVAHDVWPTTTLVSYPFLVISASEACAERGTARRR